MTWFAKPMDQKYDPPDRDVYIQQPIDRVTGNIVTIGEYHHQVNEGNAYCAYDEITIDTTTRKYKITSPAASTNKFCHMVITCYADAELKAALFEGSTGITGGAMLTIFNRDRNSEKTPLTVILGGVTVATNGQRIGGMRQGTYYLIAGGAERSASELRIGEFAEKKFILKSGTDYSLTVATYNYVPDVALAFDFYEV